MKCAFGKGRASPFWLVHIALVVRELRLDERIIWQLDSSVDAPKYVARVISDIDIHRIEGRLCRWDTGCAEDISGGFFGVAASCR